MRSAQIHGMVWEGHPVASHGQGHHPLNQVAQNLIHPGLNTTREEGEEAATSSVISEAFSNPRDSNFSHSLCVL